VSAAQGFCCDTCPLEPTCEEMADFLDQIAVPADDCWPDRGAAENAP
jgi:hypothetical protein